MSTSVTVDVLMIPTHSLNDAPSTDEVEDALLTTTAVDGMDHSGAGMPEEHSLVMQTSTDDFSSTSSLSSDPDIFMHEETAMYDVQSVEEEDKARNFSIESGVSIIPHPDKRFKGGEDAYFINNQHTAYYTQVPKIARTSYAEDSLFYQSRDVVFHEDSHEEEYDEETEQKGKDIDSEVFAFGVADGVGGWASSGVDPAIFARCLMRYSSDALSRADHSEIGSYAPVKAMRTAIDRVFDQSIRGSSTALLCVLEQRSGMLHMANVGDSGLLVFRRDTDIGGYCTVFQSEDQLHGFNFPFQLGLASNDRPENAICNSVQLQDGDILIAASDGLFDNLFDYEIREFICNNGSKSAQHIAQGLSNWAYHRSLSLTAFSPFAKKASEIGSYFPGGKSDDITILAFKVAIPAAKQEGIVAADMPSSQASQ